MQSEQMRTYLDAHTPWQVHIEMNVRMFTSLARNIAAASCRKREAAAVHAARHEVLCSVVTQEYVDEILKPRNGVENVMKWACGRPLASDLTGAACLCAHATHLPRLPPKRSP